MAISSLIAAAVEAYFATLREAWPWRC